MNHAASTNSNKENKNGNNITGYTYKNINYTLHEANKQELLPVEFAELHPNNFEINVEMPIYILKDEAEILHGYIICFDEIGYNYVREEGNEEEIPTELQNQLNLLNQKYKVKVTNKKFKSTIHYFLLSFDDYT